MYSISEQRKYKRIKKPYIIRFRVKPDDMPDTASSDWDMVAVNNLGANGVSFNSNRNMRIGTNLDLKIGFSSSAPPIECGGRVTRVKRHLNTLIFGIVTEFIDIDKPLKEMINRTAEMIVP